MCPRWTKGEGGGEGRRGGRGVAGAVSLQYSLSTTGMAERLLRRRPRPRTQSYRLRRDLWEQHATGNSDVGREKDDHTGSDSSPPAFVDDIHSVSSTHYTRMTVQTSLTTCRLTLSSAGGRVHLTRIILFCVAQHTSAFVLVIELSLRQ